MILKEGGNIFKDADGKPVTQRIARDDVDPTLDWVEKITGIAHKDMKLGSTGIKSSSGDIDVAINQAEVDKEELYQKWYAEYESGCYDELIQFVDENLDELGDKQIILKFELLRSLSVLKMFGDEDGRKSIERFIENYPKSKEAEYAKQVLDKLK